MLSTTSFISYDIYVKAGDPIEKGKLLAETKGYKAKSVKDYVDTESANRYMPGYFKGDSLFVEEGMQDFYKGEEIGQFFTVYSETPMNFEL